ncbi:PREDICTED: nuclear pore complex protein NUP1-like isoform X2 [Nelumbo nucifera]|uniref:Nuclear pore complex protein NUP1-like isoform X2 n=2 Tax=Nelumbo nucifera TaxID=4432 RepID=A0A1U7ZJE1_NELNU|nr:PREDICTED: nuclear pore complex protein NUP1-like isoform X2 [Nelumbo nucifera]DAD48307.1 TPA_asm: hypothetical protein HUJ06_018244 [Nelumbo nucifera]
MATAAGGAYEGGAGGKFRKRPFRRAPTTPYDRPATAIRNPVEARRNGWISKLVDPASRIITKSAQLLFSSVFRKGLPAPPPEVNRELRLEAPEELRKETPEELRNETTEELRNETPEEIYTSGAQERVHGEGDVTNNCSDGNGINELEKILKQKTFTRDEIDHLTELLRSRTVDIPARDDKRPEPSKSQLVPVLNRVEPEYIPGQAVGVESHRLVGSISATAVSSSIEKQILEEDIASPAELAKAYMGTRLSKVSPLGLRSQALRGDVSLLSNGPLPQKSPKMSLAPRSAVRFAGVSGASENCYLTPRPRGRSAIYSMARTPYSRVHSTATVKATESIIDGYAGPSTSSQWTWENGTLSSGKQVSKRRISVLDNDIGSVGPIRRIRQKTNLMAPSKGLGLSVPGSPLLFEEPKQNISSMKLAENGDNSVPSTSIPSIPSQSTEMARKILQQLDKLVPSPKEKSSELKLAIARERSPSKLMLSMPHEHAIRSMDEVDSSKLLPSIQGTTGGVQQTLGIDSSCQKLDKVEENVPKNMGDKLAPKANGAETTMLIKGAVPAFKTADSVTSNFTSNPPQKKRAFQMSAHEDFVEMDENSRGVCSTATLLASGKGKLDTSVMENITTSSEAGATEKSPVSSAETKLPNSEAKSSVGFIFNKITDIVASEGSTLAEKKSSPSTITQPAKPAPQLLPVFSNIAPPKEPISTPIFSFGSKSVEKPFTIAPSSFNESSGPKFGAEPGSKLENFGSPATVTSTTTETVSKTGESDKSDNGQKAVDSFRKPEHFISSGLSTSTPPSILSCGASNNRSGLSNGSLATTASIFSAPAASSANQIFSTSSTSITATTTITTIPATIASSPSTSASAPSFPVAPIFQLGSSKSATVTSNSVSAPTMSGAESTDLEPRSKQASPFGSIGSSFGTSSSFAGSSSGVFTFGASATANTTNAASSSSNQSQSSNLFSAGTGSQFGAQVASAGTGLSPFTQSMPSQFGSSASSPTFGLSGSSAFSSGSSLFGSTPSKLFGSSPAFGQGTSTTFSTGANSFSSSSSATSIFGSSSQAATSSVFGSAFGTASSPATGFSFGASSTASAAATGSTPMAFGSSIGSSSGSIFSFTSASASTSASLTPSRPLFGVPNPSGTFGTASPGNDQMNVEDSMAEDTVQAPLPAVPTFSQQATTPPSFTFGSPASASTPNIFQFSTQQSSVAPQTTSPFQGSGNLEFTGGSFSLGTGGGDKPNRKFIKVKRDKQRKR